MLKKCSCRGSEVGIMKNQQEKENFLSKIMKNAGMMKRKT